MSGDDFKCGYVALIGAPNVGKSTLLNRLVAEKVAITSPRPQTTRHRLGAVVHRPAAQLLFLDTPGIIDARGALNESLVRAALNALAEADVVVWLVTPQDSEAETHLISSHLARFAKPLVIAINKIDTISKRDILPLIAAYHQLFPAAVVVPIAALYGDGLPALLEEIIAWLPSAPPLFPPDQLTDRSERFLVAELIRERVFHHTVQEIPYAVAVQIEEFDERQRPQLVRIRAIIYVERQSQKGIVIGKHGRLLKIIGQEARAAIETLLLCRVFLELWVKVWKNWRKDPRALRELGYLE
ncbi:MAG: GTPase Era [Deltaproteobacteria bacterium]|nr:GTPase Era [Deltaproteobacteria bacterium]